jgi:SAM-dependent methyltransferase
MISTGLIDVVQCPDCAGAILREGDRFRCARCHRGFDAAQGYLDLRPAAAFAEQTKYLDEALHADARHESVSPPLLGSKIRNDMLRRFLALAPGDRVLDLGCGSGRALVWNAGAGATLAGVDISAFFARDAIDHCDVVRGDLRQLPLKAGAFNKTWSLDVLEHLSPQALREVLTEANRVLAGDGLLFVYTHVRQNGWLAGGVRAVNGLARLGERVGLIDLRQERLRKSDHLNPIADHDELRRVVADCGFRLERVTYYTPILGALIENVLVRIAERLLTRREARRGHAGGDGGPSAARAARASAKAHLGRRGIVYGAVAALTAIMQLDVLLFGRFRSGPFFALLRKTGRAGQS